MYYERRPFPVRIHGNAFAGEPRPELDAAWHGLFEGTNRLVLVVACTPFDKIENICCIGLIRYDPR